MLQIHQPFLNSFELLMEQHHLIAEEVLEVRDSYKFCCKPWGTQCPLLLF